MTNKTCRTVFTGNFYSIHFDLMIFFVIGNLKKTQHTTATMTQQQER
jgi:hypothetical protein